MYGLAPVTAWDAVQLVQLLPAPPAVVTVTASPMPYLISGGPSAGGVVFTPAFVSLGGPQGQLPIALVPGTRGDGLRLQYANVDIVPMRVVGVALSGVVVIAAGARNSTGTGRVRNDGQFVRWQAPGSSTFGTAVLCNADGTYLLEDGEDPSKWARVLVAVNYLADAGEGPVYVTDRYNALGPTDLQAAEALAGQVLVTAYTLRNVSPAAALGVLLWMDPGTAYGAGENPGLEISSDGVNFYTPTSAADPHVLAWPAIAAGDGVPVYLRRTTAAAAPPQPALLNHLEFSWRGY